MSIEQELQKLDINSGLVELYTLDCTQIGGSIYRFSPNVNAAGTGHKWNGNIYSPLPISTDGWEISANGAQTKPTLTVSNVNKVLLNAVVTLGDIVGSKLTRVRTFEKFLDEGSTPDVSAIMPPDIFIIDQKVSHDNVQITWQLSSIVDRFGMKLPRRQVLKDAGFPGVGIQIKA